MAIFKCKMCGGTLEIKAGETVATCEYCGTQQTLPRLDDERRAQMYDRANHFRRNNEFDKAEGVYEQILIEDNTDAEAYWSLVLCRYGIEYVEDPVSHKRIPTINRTQMTSVFGDENYKSALQYADIYQKDIYEKEAKAIDEIQKGILEISQKEEPFDIFICYKETDIQGRRTPDSVLANDLYHQLTKEGYKVFFSRITLEDKLGTAYEPYIFAALNSAKVMIVLGTKGEYFNAVWVKNEWKRYLALIKGGEDKMLIPAYKDMDPYDLPEDFSYLQAQDMSKLGFMQDMLYGIGKIFAQKKGSQSKIPEIGTKSNANALIKRMFIFLEDGNWEKADEYCERILDMDPENAEAYIGKILAKHHLNNPEQLRGLDLLNEDVSYYRRALKSATGDLKHTLESIERERGNRWRLEEEKRTMQELLDNNEMMLDKEMCDELYEDVIYRRLLEKYNYQQDCFIDILLYRLKKRYEIEIDFLKKNQFINVDYEKWNHLVDKRKRLGKEIYCIRLEKYIEDNRSMCLLERVEDVLKKDSKYMNLLHKYNCLSPLKFSETKQLRDELASYKRSVIEELEARTPFDDFEAEATNYKRQYVENVEEIELCLSKMEQREAKLQEKQREAELMEKIKKEEEGRKKAVQFSERMKGKTITVDCPIVVFKCPFCTKEMLIKKSIALNEGNVRCTGCGNVIEVFDESNMRALGS